MFENIREAQLNDLEFIVKAQVAMALETEDYILNPETVRIGAMAVLKNPQKGRYYLYELEGAVVACLLTTPEWSEWRNRTVLWIHSLFVQPPFRGQGIYKKMYHYLKQMVEQDPALGGLRLYVDKRNVNAQKVYEKLGMNGEHYHMYEWLK